MVAMRHDGEGDPITMTVAEYFAFVEEQDIKYEYKDGYVYAMAGGTIRHAVITANVSRHLGNMLDDGDCTVTSSDARVQVAVNTYRYPDVTVFCGDAGYVEGRTDTLTNPALLVEVVSPSSVALDHRVKLEEYTKLPSLQAYILVAQDEVKVERYLRQPSGEWLYQIETALEGTITVPSLGITLALTNVYRKVPWDEPET